VAGQHSPLDAERAEQGHHVRREVLDAVPGLRLGRPAVPALAHGDDADAGRQEVEEVLV
jgi:hypothetical protein